MDTVQSWVDAKEVNRLGEGLLKDSKAELSEDSQKQEGEGLPDSAPAIAVISALKTARETAEGSGMLRGVSQPSSEDQKEPEAEEVVVSQDIRELDLMLVLNLSEQWRERFALKAMVLMASDYEFEVLFDSLGDSRLTQVAQKLAKSSSSGSFLRVASGIFLQVVQVSTGHGNLALGVLADFVLSSGQVEALVSEVRAGLL